jgi:predicted dehydrogenase
MINRRYFFATALAATAVRRAVAANDKVNIGMIGLGGRGRALTTGFGKLGNVNITHLCEVDQANMERALKIAHDLKLPVPRQTNDMRRVLEDKSVDAVVVATPDHWHGPATILACDAGKDVYVEKPASHNIREGRLMIDAASRNKRIVQLGTQSRSRQTTIEAIEYVRSGKLGKVHAAKAWNIQMRANIGHKPDGPVPAGVDYDTWLGPAPWIPFNPNRFHYNWHWHWHFGTGDIGNDGVHQMDIARWALDVEYPDRVSGWGGKLFFDDDQQTPDSMNVTYHYPGKALVWEMRIWNPYGMEDQENGVGVYGSEGMVHIGRWQRVWGYKIFDKDGKLVRHVKDAQPNEAHDANFVECVRSRKAPNADIGIGHISSLHAHLGNIVARTGRNLRFDAGTETVIGDAEANLYVSRRYRTHWSTPKML